MHRDVEVRDMFGDHGWLAVNAHASLGEIDVLASAGENAVCPWDWTQDVVEGDLALCEVKANDGSPYMNFRLLKRERLRETAEMFHAKAFLVYWPRALAAPRWIPPSEWPVR